MKTHLFLLANILLAASFSVLTGSAAELDPKSVSYTLPDQLQWRKGSVADSVTLQGDPSKPRIYIQYSIDAVASGEHEPPSQPRDRTVYHRRFGHVVGGNGRQIRSRGGHSNVRRFYVVDIPNELHYDGAKDEERVLLIVGMGPMKTSGAVQAGPFQK